MCLQDDTPGERAPLRSWIPQIAASSFRRIGLDAAERHAHSEVISRDYKRELSATTEQRDNSQASPDPVRQNNSINFM
jgi:hypothetical protein